MTSVSQFAQYLLHQDPQRNQARLTLYNYLKHVLEPGEALTPSVITRFYGRVLQFDHWRADALNLARTVRTDLENYITQFNLPDGAGPWMALRHPDTLQTVTLKLFRDLEVLVETELEARRKSGAEIRCVKLSDGEVMALILDRKGDLEIRVYPNLAIVWGPRLRAVTPTSHLFYGADYELKMGVRQVLAGSLMTTHAFQVDPEGANGLITRGHTFQKFETFIRAKLSDVPDLFAALKRLERFFIDPQTDVYYQELITKLERANRLLNHPHPDNIAEAERTLNRGRLSLKNIFPNDRLLTLLVTHLDYGITQRRTPPTQAGGRLNPPSQ